MFGLFKRDKYDRIGVKIGHEVYPKDHPLYLSCQQQENLILKDKCPDCGGLVVADTRGGSARQGPCLKCGQRFWWTSYRAERSPT